MRRLAVMAVASAAVLTGCGDSGISDLADAIRSGSATATQPPPSASAEPTGPETVDVSGTIQVEVGSLPDGATPGGPCLTDGGYSDIHEGAQVTVVTGAGEPLAVGQLGPGRLSGLRCQFSYVVFDVSRGERFYKVMVAGRDGPLYPESDLDHPIDLSLG